MTISLSISYVHEAYEGLPESWALCFGRGETSRRVVGGARRRDIPNRITTLNPSLAMPRWSFEALACRLWKLMGRFNDSVTLLLLYHAPALVGAIGACRMFSRTVANTVSADKSLRHRKSP